MSAWMISTTHVDALLTAASEPYGGWAWYWYHDETKYVVDYETADTVGAMLLAECRASVNYRYSEAEIEPIYTFRPLRGKVDPVVILKAIACYEYQSCEHPGWEASAAHAFCEALTAWMIGRLPGMDAAPWGIDDRSVFLQAEKAS